MTKKLRSKIKHKITNIRWFLVRILLSDHEKESLKKLYVRIKPSIKRTMKDMDIVDYEMSDWPRISMILCVLDYYLKLKAEDEYKSQRRNLIS